MIYYGGNAVEPRGWICPKCGRVYAPAVAMCFYCGKKEPEGPITLQVTFEGADDGSFTSAHS